MLVEDLRPLPLDLELGGQVADELEDAGPRAQVKGVQFADGTSHLAGRKASQPVVLRSRGLSVADATTNKHGEFQLEFAGPADQLTLTLGADRSTTLITLGTLTRTQS